MCDYYKTQANKYKGTSFIKKRNNSKSLFPAL